MALFHSWLQGVTSKSAKKSENSLVVVSLDIVDREILDLERVEECYMDEERDETGLAQAACWRLWDAKDSCS